MATILGANTLSSGFDVANSVRFNSADSASMEKNAAAPTDNNKWTFSAWVKRSKIGSLQEILYGDDGSTSNYCTIRFNDTSDTLTFKNRPGSTTSTLTTKRVFRDISAWYHLVVVLDTSNGTAANRDIIYINGVRETNYSTESHSGDGDACYINFDGDPIKISKGRTGSFFDGYMSEVYFIDGQALAADSFGEFDEDSGIWKPINASGLTFGNNGFYLDFKDSSNLGNDANGGTDLTESNLAATDQSIDTCTNNFCVMNPLDNLYGAATFAEGNLQVTTRNAGYSYNTATFGVASGKWYWEIKYSAQTTADSSTNQFMPGIAKSVAISSTDHMGYRNTSYAYQSGGNLFYNNGTTSSGYDAYGIGDIAGIALDIDNLRLYVSKNGTFQNSADPAGGSDGYTITAPDAVATDLGFYFPAFGDGNDNDIKVGQLNFGSPIHAISSGNTDGNGFGNFEYAVPSGFFALCTKNLAENG